MRRRWLVWSLFICEVVTFLVLLGMLTLAGISAGFYWWPMPTSLALGLLFAGFCLYFARRLGTKERLSLSALVIIPAIFLSYVVLKDSWEMSHPINETWIIPSNYEGPIYVVHGVRNGITATIGTDKMVFRLDTRGMAFVREPLKFRWRHATYEYEFPDGSKRSLTEGSAGVIDDTSTNQRDDTVRIFFSGSGSGGGREGCTYEWEDAMVESPRYALKQSNFENDTILNLEQLYPGMCTTIRSK